MNNRVDNFLPIGTVVLMKNATKKIMITGYAAKSSEYDNLWDYTGCLWPEGTLSSDKNLLFNHKDISKIFYSGYVTDEQKDFIDVLGKTVKMYKDKADNIDNTNA